MAVPGLGLTFSTTKTPVRTDLQSSSGACYSLSLKGQSLRESLVRHLLLEHESAIAIQLLIFWQEMGQGWHAGFTLMLHLCMLMLAAVRRAHQGEVVKAQVLNARQRKDCA